MFRSLKIHSWICFVRRHENNAVAQGFVPVDVSQNQMKIDALRSIENPLLAFQKVRVVVVVSDWERV